jgi:transforming growth factor-beta-induced protein
LTSLLASDEYAGITQALIDADNVTVFAPTDAAFAEIDNGAGLSVDQISEVLTYHAALGRVFSSTLSEGQTIGMLNQQNLTVLSISGEEIVLKDSTDDGANVIEVNVHGSNGVIHVLDKVLIPVL